MDKILIVVDDSAFHNTLKSGMAEYSDQFEIITIKDGNQAIEVLKSESISLLVTEILMPRLFGLVLLEYVKKNHPEIPCITILDPGTTEQIREKVPKGVFQFIEKPIKAEDLARVMKAALDRNVLIPGTDKSPIDTSRTGGFMKGISIGSFMQVIEMEEKTCLLEVVGRDNQKGLFYFQKGELYDAVFEGMVGREAALRMIPMERPRLRVMKPPKGKIRRRIDEALMSLIMEAMKRIDED